MPRPKPLTPEELAWRCDPASFSFKTTEELPTLREVIGQDRAIKSLEFGLGITNSNYNIYVLGESGTGKFSTVKEIIRKKAESEPVPDDWCYVNNFDDPDTPVAINLPPGKGSELASEMHSLIESLTRDIPKLFESKDYEKHRDEIIEGQQERTKAVFSRLEQQAAGKGFMLKKTVSGVAVVPEKDGKPMGQADFEALPAEKRAVLEQELKILQDRLSDAIRQARNIEKETRDRINELDREVVQYVVTPHINEILDKFSDFEKVVDFINRVKADVLSNVDEFRPKEEMPFNIGALKVQRQGPSFERYMVNLIVNNKETKGAPVVHECNPTYYNIFGRIEYRVQLGVASTDFTMIKAGSAHKANGGYLIVDALDVLKNIFVYDSLKRLIKNREIALEDVWEQYRLVSTSTLRPRPIPADIKLVLVGDPFIYYLLFNMDKEYRKLFKVKSDFDSVMPRDDETVQKYASFVATRCAEDRLLPFDREGVARVVEYGARLAGDKTRVSAKFNEIKNLVIESSYFAGLEGSETVSAAHVDRARAEKRYRHSRIEDRLRDYITEDTIMVDTEGSVVGQVNGIAVLDPGDYAFGKPTRITARTFMGDDGVVNIEREVKMSGKIHNKALFILRSFLGERYAREFPITLSASLCFEQLYEEIEGDSATCTEVYALLSNLSGKPIDQGIAVTGSMNQKGEVQPIGGVNQKIEGFFDVCKARGLTGSQGVVIPKRNVKNLMLRQDVIDAVAAGEFSIYPIERVDEGLEILTGCDMGEPDAGGLYPEGTINRLVSDRLHELAKSYKAFGRPPAAKKAKAPANNNQEKK